MKAVAVIGGITVVLVVVLAVFGAKKMPVNRTRTKP
jgi:hypothetical protein